LCGSWSPGISASVERVAIQGVGRKKPIGPTREPDVVKTGQTRTLDRPITSAFIPAGANYPSDQINVVAMFVMITSGWRNTMPPRCSGSEMRPPLLSDRVLVAALLWRFAAVELLVINGIFASRAVS
jgi:hypothetical protein